MIEPVYEVFARKGREDALHHIGYVNAIDPELGRIAASTTYDEQNWLEMFIVPRAAMMAVKIEGGPSTTEVSEAMAAFIRTAGTGSFGGDELATDVEVA